MTLSAFTKGSKMNFKAIYVLWLRDLIRYFRDRVRVILSLFRPVLWLLIFGTGINSLIQMQKMTSGEDYLHFLFPGIVTLNLVFASLYSGISIIWDREFGFLKEILVAPISRTSIALGRTLSGTTIALIEGFFVFLLAPFIGVKLMIDKFIPVIIVMFLIAFTGTALGVLIAAAIPSFEGFGIVANLVVMPMFFLSGAVFPISDNLPQWLKYSVRINPLTYGVDALRSVLGGVRVFPLWVNLFFLLVYGSLVVFLAVLVFNKKG